ncbi:MAG: hypothetical protein PHW65_03205 [Dehalococcoidales bacterium]|nr:hypothetical protein [Dehalococcoidales bacterium]
MTGDPHVPRCDWLQQARIEISSNTIIFHDETFVKMVTVEDILNRLSKERQRCYRAHSERLVCNCEPKAKGDDTDPNMCKVCLPEAYMREGCSCLDMHDAAIAQAAREDERKAQNSRCHTCRTLQWDNRLIWSLEDLLVWVRANHMDQHDIRDHIDLMLGKYRQELEARQQGPDEKELVTLAFAAWLKKRDELGEIGVTESVTVTGEYLGGVYSAGWKQGYEAAIAQAPPKRQSVEQCKNCRLAGSRACMHHGYPESEIPYSCSYKIGEDAVAALHDLDGTFIDVWTVEGQRSKIDAAEVRGREDERKEVIKIIEGMKCPDFDKFALKQRNATIEEIVESLRSVTISESGKTGDPK